jgi:hypothetical protein
MTSTISFSLFSRSFEVDLLVGDVAKRPEGSLHLCKQALAFVGTDHRRQLVHAFLEFPLALFIPGQGGLLAGEQEAPGARALLHDCRRDACRQLLLLVAHLNFIRGSVEVKDRAIRSDAQHHQNEQQNSKAQHQLSFDAQFSQHKFSLREPKNERADLHSRRPTGRQLAGGTVGAT